MTNEDFVTRLVAAVNSQDAANIVSFYADDAIVYLANTPEPLRGKEAIEKDYREYAETISGFNFQQLSVVIQGTLLAFHGVSRVTIPAGAAGPGGVEPFPRVVEFPFAVFIQLNEEGLISEERQYHGPPVFQGQQS